MNVEKVARQIVKRLKAKGLLSGNLATLQAEPIIAAELIEALRPIERERAEQDVIVPIGLKVYGR